MAGSIAGAVACQSPGADGADGGGLAYARLDGSAPEAACWVWNAERACQHVSTRMRDGGHGT